MKEIEWRNRSSPPGRILRKRCSGNMQQIYKRTAMTMCDALVFSCKFAAYFQNTFL